jgi:hypothetical protein
MLRHALREDAVPNALEGAPKPEVLAGETTSTAALARLSDALKEAPRVQSNTIQAIDLLVTASHEDMVQLSKDQQDSYFMQALHFIADRFGGMRNILTATIHRDETTPHMQVLLMPRNEDGRFQAQRMIGGPPGLRELHDAFHDQVGQRFGLLRGERGQNVEHVPIKQFYAQLDKGAQPLPDYRPVPDKPTWKDTLGGRAKAMNEERAKAMEHNKRVRAEIARRAKVAGQLAPSVVSRQATRYREAVRLEALTKSDRLKAAEDRQATQQLAQIAEKRAIETGEMARAADKLWEKSGAQMLDRWTPHMAPEMVAKVARLLGVELVAGRPLLDQMRRQGRGSTLVECAQMLDNAVGGTLHGHVQSGQAQIQIERQKR